MEVNELMVSWWLEVIGIVGMIGVVSLSGCLVWFGKMLQKERDHYDKLWSVKEQLTDENTTLQTLATGLCKSC